MPCSIEFAPTSMPYGISEVIVPLQASCQGWKTDKQLSLVCDGSLHRGPGFAPVIMGCPGVGVVVWPGLRSVELVS